MSTKYVLLDAMGIQSSIFETNTLRIILGASFRLARWQEECKKLCDDHSGVLITSAGGNVLVQFDNGGAPAFKDACIEKAPEMEIAWAIVDGQKDDPTVWSELQREIAGYKAGNRKPGDYPHIAVDAGAKELCRFCGTRRTDGGGTIGNDKLVPCAPCRKRYTAGKQLHDNAFKPHGNTTMEKAMALPQSFGLETYPQELEELAARPGQDGNSNLESSDLLAVVVVDLNEMGTRVKNVVNSAEGFAGLKNFSGKLETELWDVFREQITVLANTRDGKGKLEEEKGAIRKFIRFRPLLLGGDDAVFAMPAPLWPDFVENILNGLLEKGHPACAGVAVARHTFPINKLVEMAEELVASAKARSRCCYGEPSVDWHLHQETAFSKLQAARRRKYIKDTPSGFQVSTRRPYTLTDFRELRLDAANLDLHSNRKEFTLYEALIEGRQATRDALVHVFLRGEDDTLSRYGSLWPHVLDGDEDPLWTQTDYYDRDGTQHTLFDTRMADMLELCAFSTKEECHD